MCVFGVRFDFGISFRRYFVVFSCLWLVFLGDILLVGVVYCSVCRVLLFILGVSFFRKF